VRARATDTAGHTQPEHAAPNPGGYGNNSIHEVRVNARLTRRRRMRRIVAPGVIAAVLLAALSEGCRTAGAGGKVDPDPAWTAAVRP
jgi:hypothetical protein